ncbi:hypothetical protein ACV5Z5_004651 [Salmonella enterica subsp. enterica]
MILDIPDEDFNAFMSALAAYVKYVGSIEPLTKSYEDNRTAKQG